MQHPDEGMIHAWIDGALDTGAARELEAHLAECPECARVAAEARGLVAASSRILTALDNVLGDVIPAGRPPATPPQLVRPWATPFWMRTAASVLIVAGVSALFLTGKLNNPERKRADIVAAAPQMEGLPASPDSFAVHTTLPGPSLASPPPSARKSPAPAAQVAEPQPLSAKGAPTSPSRQKVATAATAKDAAAETADKEQGTTDRVPREERVAEAVLAQKSLEKQATVAAVPTAEAARRAAAASAVGDLRGVLSGVQTSAGRAAVGGAGSQRTAAPSMTAPTAQSMPTPSAMRRELMSSSDRARAATGCYALTLSPWSGGTIPFGAPPPRIELDSLTSVEPSIRGLRLVHPARGAASNGAPIAYWKLVGDSIYVTWEDDEHGVNLALPVGEEVTRGRAWSFNMPTHPFPQRAEVEARRISCRD